MVIYWPNKQSIELNLAVSNLFAQTYQKIFFKLSSKTSSCLPIDIFSQYTKKQLLIELLIEFEILVIDIIELNLSTKEVKKLNDQILLHLVNTVTERITSQLCVKEINSINFHFNYNKLFFQEHSFPAYILLTYLIFGSENIARHIFPFRREKTPFYHVKALFENLVIQISNVITFNLLENSESIQKTHYLTGDKYMLRCNHRSIRKISNFKNNLISNNLISFYVHYPHSIYCGKYKVCLLSSKGIIYKHIYLNRACEYLQLSNYQLSSIIYLEIQDFIVPRINRFIALIGRLIIYVFIEIISKNLNITIKHIIAKFNMKKY